MLCTITSYFTNNHNHLAKNIISSAYCSVLIVLLNLQMSERQDSFKQDKLI